jgi:hypothetical protein
MEEQVKKIEARVLPLGKRLEELAAKAAASGSTAGAAHRRGIDELKSRYEAAQSQFADLRSASADAWKIHVFKPALLAFMLLTTATIGACATVPLKSESSTSEIRAAEEVGAHQVPQAALHLQLAKEELASAEALSVNGEHEEAASMLTRAHADAELAVALSRQDSEKKEAMAAMARVRELRADNEPLETDTASTER